MQNNLKKIRFFFIGYDIIILAAIVLTKLTRCDVDKKLLRDISMQTSASVATTFRMKAYTYYVIMNALMSSYNK